MSTLHPSMSQQGCPSRMSHPPTPVYTCQTWKYSSKDILGAVLLETSVSREVSLPNSQVSHEQVGRAHLLGCNVDNLYSQGIRKNPPNDFTLAQAVRPFRNQSFILKGTERTFLPQLTLPQLHLISVQGLDLNQRQKTLYLLSKT